MGAAPDPAPPADRSPANEARTAAGGAAAGLVAALGSADVVPAAATAVDRADGGHGDSPPADRLPGTGAGVGRAAAGLAAAVDVVPAAATAPAIPAQRDPRRVALVRAPSPRLADGITTHIAREPVDADLARQQHAAYRAALASTGWTVVDVEPADDLPDSVFVEDMLVVAGGLAIVTRPGAAERRPETAGAEAAAGALGLDVVRIEEPGTLDGGDVLQVGDTVYVGRGGRTNFAGVEQLRQHLEPRGKRVVPVALRGVLHLKSAVTALPDGVLLALPHHLDLDALPPVLPVEEESGCHVVPLDDDRVLIAASAPHTAALIRELGFTPVVVDISEYEKREGCVTCLNVLISPLP